ncbi:MAG: carboxypeptidase regulatory-like domain-containing protein, partial [Planctomycetales bacterium]|nr:carboxypeptidase regulatory-like domain-containing protein [Planctomycetales bacterium]
NLTPGVYQVRETQPSGYFSAGAIPGTVSGTATGSTVNGNADILTEINIPLGNQHGVHYDFAEYLPSSIRGHVHLTDKYGNCDEASGTTTPLAGVQLILKDATGKTIGTTQTNAAGDYEFTNLLPGTYTVVEMTPAGLLDGDEEVGTINGIHVGVATDDQLAGIVLTGGQNGIHYDFCEHLPAELSGYVYHDANNNGVFDVSESPIPGTTVILTDAGGTQVAQQTTDQNGFYKFSGLSLGKYTIVEVQPVGWLDGKDAAGKIGGITVGQADNPGDKIRNIDLHYGEVGVHYDFGELKPASIAGKVFYDPNEDCIFNENDQPLSGVTVQLLNAQGTVIQTTRTDSNGEYRFDNLLPGTYAVRELQPAGYLQGGTTPGSGGGDASIPDLISGIDIPSGAQLVDYDFCEIKPVSIAGRVFVDIDDDCIFDANEQPLSGVKVELLDGNGIVVQTTLTNAQGQYHFDNLPPNSYSVHEFQPKGYFQGGQMAGSHGGDDMTDDLIQDVNLMSGDNAVEYNFCEKPGGSISGYVFRDGAPIFSPDGKVPSNLYDIRDGLLTPDDQRIGGVLLELRFSNTALPVTAADVLPGFYSAGPIRIRTDANGYYEFRGLPPGNYTIVEVDQPAGYLDSRDTPGSTSGMALNLNTALIPGLIDPFIQEGIPLRNDAILQVSLAAGQHSAFNNFSEVQLTTFVIPPPPPPLPPPPPMEPLPYVPPQLIPPPPVIIPPVAPPEYIGGAGVAYSWHLSIVNAGLPRMSSRSTKITGLAWRPVMLVDGAQWRSDRLAGGTWQIDTLSPGVNEPIAYGIVGAIPVTGDWDGDGTTEIGIFYKGEWLLDLNGNGKWDADDLWAKLGDEGDLPVVGDWDGDGKDDIGIFGPEWAADLRHHKFEPGLPDPQNQLKKRPKNVPPQPDEATEGDRLLKLTASGNERADLIDHVFYFGAASDIPIAGDWNGDGIDSIGVFRDGQWHFDMDGDGRWSKGDQVIEFGQDGDLPVVGDFNGDGIDEIGIYRAGKWIIDTNGNRKIDAADKVVELGSASDQPVVGDFDGDGTDEPALYREGKAGDETAQN